MLCVQHPSSPPGPGALDSSIAATVPRAVAPAPHHHRYPSTSSVLSSSSASARNSTFPLPMSHQQANLQQHQHQHNHKRASSVASTACNSIMATTTARPSSPSPSAPTATGSTASRSRAERSLLSVLERERKGRGTAAGSIPTPVSSSGPTSSVAPSSAQQIPSSWPPMISPMPSRPQSRAPSRGPSRSASPTLLRDALGFGYPTSGATTPADRELDLASLVERSIALQSSSPANTPPSSPPRPRARPYFSTSPSLSATATIAENTESDTDNHSSGPHRRRAATLTTVGQGVSQPYGERSSHPSGLPAASTARRPSMGSRTRSTPTPTAPVPRRAAAMAAASSLLPNPNTGLTYLSPAARDQASAHTPSNTLAVRASQRAPIASGMRQSSPPEHPLRPLSPYSYPSTNPNIPSFHLAAHGAQQQPHLRPVISVASVASAASAQSNVSMLSAHSHSRVPITPAITPPSNTPPSAPSPLNPRSPSRRETLKRSPRPISGPFLAPTMTPAEADLPFDLDRAARRLRDAPGRVCFNDVALFPPSDDADDEEEEDSARKRPRMGRRWSLW